jgi:hypothetical protein
MSPAAAGAPVRSRTQFWFSSAAVLFIFLAHAPFWSLPFYWDELGQFVPAALDIFQTSSWIPHSTVPNVHPPGVMAYMAGVWWIFGYSITVTRLAMLALAAGGAAVTMALAMRMGLQPGAAVLAAVFLSVSPLYFAQAMMAQLDMPAMAFTALALLLFLADRMVLCAIACVVLVLFKETGIVAAALFGCWLWFEKRRSEALWFLLPLAPLAVWLIALQRATGHWFGNAAFTDYNLFYPLHPVRLVLALLRRLYYLFVGSGHIIGAVACVTAFGAGSIFRTRAWRIAGWLAAGNLLVVIVLGGAVLERYLLPVLPILYIAFAAALWTLPLKWRTIGSIALAAALITAIFRNPPYPFPFENNLAFTDFVSLHAEAARHLERNAQDRKIATMFPLSSALIRREFGYVTRPLRVREVYDFRAANIAPLLHEDVEFLVLYTTAWDPWGLMENPAWTGLLRRFYQYEPPITGREAGALLGMRLEARWTRGGQWIEIYRRSAMTASASISTSHSGSINRTTCMTVFAGRMSRKNSPCIAATFSRSSMRVSRMRVRVTSESFAPACSRASRMISMHRRAWAAASPDATVRPSFKGAVPATATMRPDRTAREIPIRGSYGEPEEINWRDGFCMT